MVLTNISNKEVNLLVNGNQQEKFIQQANSADYDVSVSQATDTVTQAIVTGSKKYDSVDPGQAGEYEVRRDDTNEAIAFGFNVRGSTIETHTFTNLGTTISVVQTDGGDIDVSGASRTFTTPAGVNVSGFSQSTSPDIDFGSKAVDVLVNGNVEGNFTQTAPSADYDVTAGTSANDITVFEDSATFDGPSPDLTGTYTLGEEVGQADELVVFVRTPDNGTFDVDVSLDGTTIINIDPTITSPFEQATTLSNPSSGDTLDYRLGHNADGATVIFKVIAKQEASLSINSVTQS